MKLLSFVALSVIVVSFALPGCKSTGGTSGQATHVFVDPAFSAPEAARIPIIGIVNTSTDAEATQYFFSHFEEAMRTKPQYTVLAPWSTKRDVRRKKVQAEYDVLEESWRDDRTFDLETLRAFGAAMDVSYVMGGEVSEWKTEEININVEGYSHSDVAASFKMFDVKTGAVVWEARDEMQLKGAYYDPSSGSGRKDDLGIVRGESRVVPAAPSIDECARRVAGHLAASFP